MQDFYSQIKDRDYWQVDYTFLKKNELSIYIYLWISIFMCSVHLEYAYPIMALSCFSQVNWKKKGLLPQGECPRPQINIENAGVF